MQSRRVTTQQCDACSYSTHILSSVTAGSGPVESNVCSNTTHNLGSASLVHASRESRDIGFRNFARKLRLVTVSLYCLSVYLLDSGDGRKRWRVATVAAVSAARASKSAIATYDLGTHKHLLGQVCRQPRAQPELQGRSLLVRLRQTLFGNNTIHHATCAVPTALWRWWLLIYDLYRLGTAVERLLWKRA